MPPPGIPENLSWAFKWRNTEQVVVVHEPMTVGTLPSPVETEWVWHAQQCCISGAPIWVCGDRIAIVDPHHSPSTEGASASASKADEQKTAASKSKQPSGTSAPSVAKPSIPSGVSAVAYQPGGSGPASSQRKGSKPCHKCGSPNRSWYRTVPKCRWEQQSPGSCKYREKRWFAHQGPKLSIYSCL